MIHNFGVVSPPDLEFFLRPCRPAGMWEGREAEQLARRGEHWQVGG